MVQTLEIQPQLVIADEPDIDTRIRTLVDQLSQKIDRLSELLPVPGSREYLPVSIVRSEP